MTITFCATLTLDLTRIHQFGHLTIPGQRPTSSQAQLMLAALSSSTGQKRGGGGPTYHTGVGAILCMFHSHLHTLHVADLLSADVIHRSPDPNCRFYSDRMLARPSRLPTIPTGLTVPDDTACLRWAYIGRDPSSHSPFPGFGRAFRTWEGSWFSF